MEPKQRIVAISVGAPYIEHAQYHRGVGGKTVLGVGSTPREALEDALEDIAQRPDLELACPEPDADAEFGKDADRYLAEEEIALEDRQPAYWIEHRSVTGCHPLTRENAERYSTLEDARDAFQAYLEDLESRGFELDDRALDETEVLEPEDCAMVPDEVGTVRIVDDVDECERENERTREESELHVYVELELEFAEE